MLSTNLTHVNSYSKYTGIILLGYFSTQIFMNLLGIYNKKKTNQEVKDIIILLVLSNVIFSLTNIKQLNIGFLIGYFVGLLVPTINEQFFKNYSGSIDLIQLIYYTMLLFIIGISIFTGLSNPLQLSYYLVYIITIIIIILGLFITRKKEWIVPPYGSGYKRVFSKKINLSITMISFLLSLSILNTNNNSESLFISLIQGVFIASFVSCMSYYGFQYFFTDSTNTQKTSCINDKDCNSGYYCNSGRCIIKEKPENIKNIDDRISSMQITMGMVISLCMISVVLLFIYRQNV